jgi:uncharacterized membrane protein (UPF0127 family)
MAFVKINGESFPTLIAVTEEEQARGLMFREWPPPVMAFPSKLGVRKFWMKNTYCPLDIVFCRGGKIIQICRGEPLSTMAVGPNHPSDLVVEFPAGTMDKYGVRVGDKIALSG